MTSPEQPPVPLLFLIGDTGGGHRSAATAVAQALEHAWPGRFAPVICDPLRGPGAPRLLRWVTGLYAPCIRLTPWLWGMIWRASGSPLVLGWLRRTLIASAHGSVARAVAACQPAVVVSFHPVTAEPAVCVRDRGARLLPVITVITDLITPHLSWRDAAVDRVIVPSAAIADQCTRDGMPDGRCVETGLPVAAEFCRAPLSAPERRMLQRSLGLRGRFLVVVTGGAEGSGGIYRRTAAILRQVENVDVAVICGRNRLLRRRLTRLAARAGGRLTVHGFVDNMADWLRCADIVVGKAGPGTIAEAMCCAAPLVLTSYVPGQEEGNAEFVVRAGAGVYAPRPRRLAAEIGRLRRDPAALAAMRAASARAGRPSAAADIARLLAEVARDRIGWSEQRALISTSHSLTE
jgi:1,2-diacylglycerol 3-beta-galactosyltransferase